MSHWNSPIVSSLVAVAAAAVVLRQCRKPSRWLGRGFLLTMNRSHAGVTGWGLSHFRIGHGFTMLDVGCGGGQTVATLAATSRDAHVDGVDYSAESVATARRTNRASIESGRVTIQQASVSHLPFADGTFDLVTAVETHYYWPNLLSDVQEIRRVLRPGGRFALIAETYRGRSFDLPFRLIMTLLRATYLTAGEHRALLTTNGFVDIELYEEPAKGWICVTGLRPDQHTS